MQPGIGSTLVTPKAAEAKAAILSLNVSDIRWKKDTDVDPPLMAYRIGTKMNPICTVSFTPYKLKNWKIELEGQRPVFFSGTREEKQKMLMAAEAMIAQLQKEAA